MENNPHIEQSEIWYWQNKELELVSRMGQTLNSILDIDQVLTVLLNEVRNLLNVTGASIWLDDNESGDVVCRQAAGVQVEKVRSYHLKPKSGIAGWVCVSGQSVIVSDTREDCRYHIGVDEKMEIELRSILSVPLRARGNIIGAIQMVDMRPNRFKTTHQTLLEALAGTAAVAIENARLFQNLEKQTDTLLKTNIKLEREIYHRKKAEAELNKYKQQLENKVERQTVELNRTRMAMADLKGDIKRRYRFGKIVGKSDSMQAIYALIQDLVDVPATVLITGESGTGKELVAEALHTRSELRDKPFIKVNCAALSESVLESELFGHVKGAFTGADKDKIGWFQKAADGVILLDEIGDVSLNFQKRLLRVLQEREFERLGDTTTLSMNARVLAATNQNLLGRVKQGGFRQDLYYRLKVVEIKLPSVRERKEDIPLLIHHFLDIFNEELGKKIEGVSSEVLRILMTYHWPGNVRELRNALEHSCILCKNTTIVGDDLPVDFPDHDLSYEQSFQTLVNRTPPSSNTLPDDKETLLKVIEEARGNKTRAAEIFGISRRTLYRRLKKYQL